CKIYPMAKNNRIDKMVYSYKRKTNQAYEFAEANAIPHPFKDAYLKAASAHNATGYNVFSSFHFAR
ncbi:hypothetical protein L9F63_022726, partial [Diploptera punctata]